MDVIVAELAKLLSPYVLYIAAALLASEILGSIPAVKQNSVYQIVVNVLQNLWNAVKAIKPTPTDPPPKP